MRRAEAGVGGRGRRSTGLSSPCTGRNSQERLEWVSMLCMASSMRSAGKYQDEGRPPAPRGLCLKDGSGWKIRAQDPEPWVLCSRRHCPVVRSCVTLVRPCPSGFAYNMRRLQEVTLRVIRDFPASHFCDIGGCWAISTLGSPYKLGRLCQEGPEGMEVKLPWRPLWGQEPGGRMAGPGGLGGPG